jgi:hypothetical protein
MAIKAKTRFWRVFASPSIGEFSGGGRTRAASTYVLADKTGIVKAYAGAASDAMRKAAKAYFLSFQTP